MNDEISTQQRNTSTVGFIGAGKNGTRLLNLFMDSQYARVAYMVDKDSSAPALFIARKAGIPTFTDFHQAIQEITADFVFEVTGSNKVAELVQQELVNSQSRLVTHDMAHIILTVIEESRQKTTDMVSDDILEIRKEISHSLDTVNNTVSAIKQTTSDMRYLALNARIEAARAGDQGRGFGIVAQQVEQLAQTVRDLAQEVERVNTDLLSIAGRIDTSLGKLR